MLLRFIPFPFSRSRAGNSLTTVFGEISSNSPIASRTLTGVRGRSSVSSPTNVEPLGLADTPLGDSVALLANSLTRPGESLEGLLSTLVSPEVLRVELSR